MHGRAPFAPPPPLSEEVASRWQPWKRIWNFLLNDGGGLLRRPNLKSLIDFRRQSNFRGIKKENDKSNSPKKKGGVNLGSLYYTQRRRRRSNVLVAVLPQTAAQQKAPLARRVASAGTRQGYQRRTRHCPLPHSAERWQPCLMPADACCHTNL